MSDPYDQVVGLLFNLDEVISRDTLFKTCEVLGLQIVIKEKNRGDGRKAHYGAGKQPIDTIKELGWGAQFCAGNVLKYLRRDKAPEHSQESARVYWRWLLELVLRKEDNGPFVLAQLIKELTAEELLSLPKVEQ